MKITNIEALYCDAGWRPWTFIKISTDSGIVGYSECTDSNGAPNAIDAIVYDLRSQLIGKGALAHEDHFWTLYRATRQSTGGMIQKTIAGIENALLDIKGKAFGVPVYELFGGPSREKVRLYWSHCGTTRVRSADHIKKAPIASYADVVAMGKEVRAAGYTALKTNMILPGSPATVLMQGFRGGYGSSDQLASPALLQNLQKLMSAFREGAGPDCDLILDLNFNFKTEGNIAVSRALEGIPLYWVEIDSYDPRALLQVKQSTRLPITSGENLYLNRGYRPFFEQHAMDVAAVDVIWNGFYQSKKIADLAELYEINVAPHNHSSHLATLISAQFCASIPNVKILETDVDDVPWKDALVTHVPQVQDGHLILSRRPGWGSDLNEDVIREHPWRGLKKPS